MGAGRLDEVGIRPWAEDDLSLLIRLLGTEDMTRYLGGPESLEQLRKRHKRYMANLESGEGSMFAIVVGSHRVSAGSVGYWVQEEEGAPVWETGWSVLPEFQGMGVATRAAAAVIEQARSDSRHRYIHAYPSVDNAPSNAVCRKLGFELLGIVDFEYPPGNAVRGNNWRLDLFQ